MMQLTIAGRSYELSETLESEQLAPIFDDAWTASRVWLASQYLSEHLVAFAETQEQPLLLKDGATVIELGSGCGLAGLVAASLGGNVLLTDQQQAVDLLVRNIDTNAAGASERSRLHATEFTWGTDPATCLPRSTYDYVLVSDCINPIYGTESWRNLARSIAALSHTNTVTYLSHEARGDDEALVDFLQFSAPLLVVERIAQRQKISLFKITRRLD